MRRREQSARIRDYQSAGGTGMPQDWSFVVWIVVLAIPVGLMLATFWSRSREPGAARLDRPRKDDPREPS